MRFRVVKALAALVPVLMVGAGQAAAQVRVGPVIGANLATVGGEDAEDFKSTMGVVFGAFASLEISPRFAIQPQVLYSMKGAKEDEFDSKLRLNYIQVPVLAQIRFPGSSSVTPYLLLGPSLGFKASCKIEVAGESIDCDDTDTEVAGTDLSLIGGVGLDVGPNVTLALRYDYGLTRLDQGTNPDDVFNRALTFTVGYGVRLNPAR